MLPDFAIGLVVYLALAFPLAVIVGKGLRRSRETFELEDARETERWEAAKRERFERFRIDHDREA